eukprot:652526-Pyramimonas_sp.AAC.1
MSMASTRQNACNGRSQMTEWIGLCEKTKPGLTSAAYTRRPHSNSVVSHRQLKQSRRCQKSIVTRTFLRLETTNRISDSMIWREYTR